MIKYFNPDFNIVPLYKFANPYFKKNQIITGRCNLRNPPQRLADKSADSIEPRAYFHKYSKLNSKRTKTIDAPDLSLFPENAINQPVPVLLKFNFYIIILSR